MPELNANTCKIFKANLGHYSLLEIIHHVVGNELAIIVGYTNRLQRAIWTSEQPLEQKAWAQSREKWEDYLRIITQKEAQLNDFLTQIRVLTLHPADERFCSTMLKLDVTGLVQKIIDRLFPLFCDQEIQVHVPEQPYFIVCDPLWIEVVLEHLFTHNLAFHDGSEPATISLECRDEPAYHLHEVQISIRVTKRPVKRIPIAEGKMFETWSQTLDQRDQDVCIALCYDILQKHGGRLWTEQGQEQAESMIIALPLASEASAE
ncbi:HAMP domain-containing histidine kinase [Dictyobacter formicarum]|uniref:Histidine kinase domain-containing protein n=1 Tax=Dictyobacter formicarum TaxID=2778368 RepID=A0ABQ3VNV2_9CHLR|nr:HAMP domain-containing histidine kinase [Dictyobacter formicarum]GHO87517.1 hypothetical protein KSZ_55230 [Dictyobacter formicarum]